MGLRRGAAKGSVRLPNKKEPGGQQILLVPFSPDRSKSGRFAHQKGQFSRCFSPDPGYQVSIQLLSSNWFMVAFLTFLWKVPALGLSIRSQTLKFGEDWVFLFLLGISMASLSFGLDVVTSKCQQANLWVYEELADHRSLQYFSWVFYHAALAMVSAASAKYLSPQAAGSGIPELKVALRGVVLHEFFTFWTFVAKLVGVVCTLAAGSTVFLGKVGPFVHMATILAMLLGKVMVKFAGSAENPGRKYELMVAGVAVGVACCFVAPVGGVLFGVEATGTHFAVRDYWRGFFAATCAALTFRLLAVLNNTPETVAVLFWTSWRVEFPYDLPELLSYAILGVLSGGLCCIFLFCHRSILMFLQRRTRVKRIMANNKILHAGFISLLLASITFPHGSGQYIGSRLSMKELLETFFSNVSWGLEEANSTHRPHYSADPGDYFGWAHPDLSSLEVLSFFLLAKFFMVLLATSMVIPAGYFLPVFVYGAALGRLYGEVMAKIFPDGIVSEGIHMRITPAGYALAGAAAYSGAVTQTISTALLTFELTGQMSHILPVLVAVLVSNAISQRLQPSFFEGIIIAKKLPFLPKLSVGKSQGHNLYAEDFMVTDLQYLSWESKYKDLRRLLKTSSLKQFPLVDSQESRILLGSIKRKHLSRLLSEQLSSEKRFQHLLHQSEETAKKKEGETGPNEGRGDTSVAPREEEPPASSVSGGPLVEGEEQDKTSKSIPGSADSRLPPKKDHWRYYNMVEEWECQQLQETLPLEAVPTDPAPYRLLPKETLYQCYDLFNLLSLRTAYVTDVGRLVGVVSLKELKRAVEQCVKGTIASRPQQPSSEPSDQE
ncbi:chloride channel protein ClC-Ka-like isoform X2 [Sceloporus undulatus]|uniref:chloride channel protein ClC-Ka-like isoform X2 n=1 Tax=Sceloporus undulatus TaxID=8520 RepID=UPI001C4C46B9|nr:chloride channel protein ClC-Ka-like isoform X2 [Sceloporus undulatus]